MLFCCRSCQHIVGERGEVFQAFAVSLCQSCWKGPWCLANPTRILRSLALQRGLWRSNTTRFHHFHYNQTSQRIRGKYQCISSVSMPYMAKLKSRGQGYLGWKRPSLSSAGLGMYGECMWEDMATAIIAFSWSFVAFWSINHMLSTITSSFRYRAAQSSLCCWSLAIVAVPLLSHGLLLLSC